MRVSLSLIAFILMSNINALSQIDFTPNKSITQIKEEHSLLKKISYPNLDKTIVDSLLNADINNFDSLLNIAYLVKYDSLYNSNMYDLIKKLGTETDEDLLITASELSSYVTSALIALDKVSSPSKSFYYWRHFVGLLVLGYEYGDFMLDYDRDYLYRSTTNTFTKKYYSYRDTYHGAREILGKNLSKYIGSLSYDSHQSKYHQLSLDAFRKGIIHPKYKYSVIQQIIKQETLNRNDEYLNDYLSIIDNIDIIDALSIIEFIGSNAAGDYYPQLFLDLLSHKNEEIVNSIISRSSYCWDSNLCQKVKIKLQKIFNGKSEPLKFNSAFTLMHDYNDGDAYSYLIDKVENYNSISPDTLSRAISWLGDSCHSGKIMSPRLESALSNHLQSDDPRIKRATLNTYLTYNGKNVIDAIIPFVGFELDFIAKQVTEKLLAYENKSYTIEKIKQYIMSHKETTAQAALLEILEK